MSLRDHPWQPNASKSSATLALLLSSLVAPLGGFAQQPDSLIGLEHIEVEVTVYLDFQNTEKEAITERLQRQAEKILRESRVALVDGQSLDDPLGVWLRVNVQMIDLEEQAIVLIDSSVIQGTSLLRDPTVETMATTWNTSSWVITEKDDAILSAEEKIGEHMNLFVKDLRAFSQ